MKLDLTAFRRTPSQGPRLRRAGGALSLVAAFAAFSAAAAQPSVSQPAQSPATAPVSNSPFGVPVQAPVANPGMRLAIDRGPGNLVEYGDRRAFGRFLANWRAGRDKPVTIAHFGDSHVQNGFQVAAIRERLQGARGYGGRGMIFPYSIARTYSQEDYTSSFTGTWRTANSMQQPPRLPVGVSGFAAVTSDAAASTTMTFEAPPARGALSVTVHVQAEGPYRLTLKADGVAQTREIAPQGTPQQIKFEFASLSTELRLDIERVVPETAVPGQMAPITEFTLHGLDIRDAAPGGLVYHNLGVGGAAYSALVDQTFFEAQFDSLDADLVVLDWGTNDIIYNNNVAPNLESIVRRTIRRIRAADPDVAILISAPMNARFRRRDVTAATDLAELLRRVAFEEDCLFYDWYAISGGAEAMPAWIASGIASRDGVHLTSRGYNRKGDTFAEALLRTINLASGESAATRLTRPDRENWMRAFSGTR